MGLNLELLSLPYGIFFTIVYLTHFCILPPIWYCHQSSATCIFFFPALNKEYPIYDSVTSNMSNLRKLNMHLFNLFEFTNHEPFTSFTWLLYCAIVNINDFFFMKHLLNFLLNERKILIFWLFFRSLYKYCESRQHNSLLFSWILI